MTSCLNVKRTPYGEKNSKLNLYQLAKLTNPCNACIKHCVLWKNTTTKYDCTKTILMTTVRKLKERKKENNLGGGYKDSTSSCIISLVPQSGQCYRQTELHKR